MALGESNKVLYNGQWVTYEEYWKATGTGPYSFTDKNATYSPAPTQFVDNNKPVVSTNNPNNPFETVKDNTPASEQKAADNGFSEDLQILRATRQDNGEIAFQVAASKEANNLGVITQYGNTKTSNLTARQKAQLEAYIKAHPEQQTAPSKKIKYYNAYGMPVYDGEQDPLDLTKSDPFASGDQSLAETQQDDVTNSAPLVITFGYAGKDQSMGLLMPDTMVYPITNDVKTIYPSKIPLSMEEDPRNGLYAVGFEGTVQNVIFLDPGTGKFYSKFLSKPTPAYDIAVFSRDSLGMKSGTEFVNAEINEHETEILLNPLNKDWVKNNVKLTVNKPEGYKPVRVQSPEEMAATPKLVDVLGVPSDSAFARSMDPDYNAKKLQAIEFTERAQSFGQQFSLSMIPLPNFIAKPIGMGVSKVVGVVEKAPVVGGALSSINKFMAISPGDALLQFFYIFPC
jgi:hypothetical protein